ncbi:RND transporter [Geomonas sp. Red69]|uniref:RND transporter n=1 Tax=Geomonas diazotrophica TaxID=2843197 RepID=A0ABX8JMH6_9BACT|nr:MULTISPECIES: RND transporter [Geomonas]MBU5637286.1 RND transporter [Geomonas diazotrophica]QWV99574.1 RND transporter [Geomonas nitrogeniifigens]QXE88748.1 RND transporter [Geomonas nitrogeniifigens]
MEKLKLPGYGTLIPIALLLGFAPFVPEPHLFGKVRMLLSGTLVRPLDVFDLFWHAWPFALLACRVVADLRGRRKAPQ